MSHTGQQEARVGLAGFNWHDSKQLKDLAEQQGLRIWIYQATSGLPDNRSGDDMPYVLHANLFHMRSPFPTTRFNCGVMLWIPPDTTISGYIWPLPAAYRYITSGNLQEILDNVCPMQVNTARAARRFIQSLVASYKAFTLSDWQNFSEPHELWMKFERLVSDGGHLRSCIPCQTITSMHAHGQVC